MPQSIVRLCNLLWFWNLKQVEGSFTPKLLPKAGDALKWGVLGGRIAPLKPACLILHHSENQDTGKYFSVLPLKPSCLIFTIFGLETKMLALFKAMAKFRNVNLLMMSTVSKGKKRQGEKKKKAEGLPVMTENKAATDCKSSPLWIKAGIPKI